jgi:hypothetical protein
MVFFIVFQIDSIHAQNCRIIIAVASPPSNTRSYVSFQRLTANIIKRLLIVSGKVVIKKNQSYSIFSIICLTLISAYLTVKNQIQ